MCSEGEGRKAHKRASCQAGTNAVQAEVRVQKQTEWNKGWSTGGVRKKLKENAGKNAAELMREMGTGV